MARTNVKAVVTERTHEGAPAMPRQPKALELERAVATCLLWEDTFYEKGNDIAERIAALCAEVPAEIVAALAVKARTEWHLRHVSLFLARQLAKHAKGAIVGDTIAAVVNRADELAEFLSLYWKDNGKRTLSAQVKRGLALAFPKFSAYNLAKYNRDEAVKLRDVLFLSHAKPKDAEQAEVWKKLIDGTLEAPDTWEVALSAGQDKKATWERLLRENQLGALALLRNLRGMTQVNVDPTLIREALSTAKTRGVLPFQFVAAMRYGPSFAADVEPAMYRAVEGMDRLTGTTALVVDVSGSMDAALSQRSQLNRIDAAGALAILLREIADCRVFTFSNALVEVPNVRGFGLIEAVQRSQQHGGTYLDAALLKLRDKVQFKGDRVIVVTDEQAHDNLTSLWTKTGYLVNCAPYKPGLMLQGGWVRVNGFSERIVDWVRAAESLQN